MLEETKTNKAISNFLSGELKKRGITHEGLAIRLKEQGLSYSTTSITAKLHRGTFSATFLMQCLIVIGCESADIAEIKKIITE